MNKWIVKYFLLLQIINSIAFQIDAMPIEIHGRLLLAPGSNNRAALTFDACSGKYDKKLIDFLLHNRIPATLFVTKKWIDQNPAGVGMLKANLDLFDIENHGERHIPAVIGAHKWIYGIQGATDIFQFRSEVTEGARAILQSFGISPRWYRGATGEYDLEAIREIEKMGYKIAGFSINADEGGTLSQHAIKRKLEGVKSGDVIIAHMNKPDSDTAEGFSSGLRDLIARGFVFVRLDQSQMRRAAIDPYSSIETVGKVSDVFQVLRKPRAGEKGAGRPIGPAAWSNALSVAVASVPFEMK